MLLHLLLMVKGKPAHIGAGQVFPHLSGTPRAFSGVGHLQEEAGYKKAPGCFAGPGVSKKPPGRSERQDIRGQCAAAHNSSLLGRMIRNPLGCMLPRTEDDATMTYIYPVTPPGCRP